MKQNKEKFISIYIHIPFCKAKCYYCDFNSFSGCESLIHEYFISLNKEIKTYIDKLQKYTIRTIFIGGGTPSFVDEEYIYNILELLYKNLRVAEDAEITIEVNPGTVSKQKFLRYKEVGINRLSIGVQSADNEILRKLGRIHTFSEFVSNYNLAREIGFNNISVDLIFGIPFQTLNQWKQTLKEILVINPEHISCYSLSIEEGTVFGKLREEEKIKYIDDEIDREMYSYTIKELQKYQYEQYEISNFAKNNFQSVHNRVYWKNEEYVGIGAGAHSYFDGERYNNISNVEEYINKLYDDKKIIMNVEKIDFERKISDYMILGLRLLEGINKDEFKQCFGKDLTQYFSKQVNFLKQKKLIEEDERSIRLTRIGLDLANEVFIEFI